MSEVPHFARQLHASLATVCVHRHLAVVQLVISSAHRIKIEVGRSLCSYILRTLRPKGHGGFWFLYMYTGILRSQEKGRDLIAKPMGFGSPHF